MHREFEVPRAAVQQKYRFQPCRENRELRLSGFYGGAIANIPSSRLFPGPQFRYFSSVHGQHTNSEGKRVLASRIENVNTGI